MAKEIIITVSPTGETKLETKGYAGQSCKAATREMEAALGAVQSDKPTAEMYRQQTDARLRQ